MTTKSSSNKIVPGSEKQARGLTVRSVLALIVLGLSVFFFFASLVGIAAAWLYNVRLTDQALAELATIESDLDVTAQYLQNAQSELESARQQIDIFQTALESIGLDAAENTRVLAEIVSNVEGKVTPVLDTVSDMVGSFRERFVALKETLESLNDLPLINLEIPGVDRIDEIAQSIADLQQQILDTKQKVQDISNLTQETVETFSSGFQNWEGKIEANLVQIEAYQARIASYQARVDSLQASVPVWLDWTAAILTVLFVWLAFSQVGLFVVAWRLFKGEDLLAGWKG